MSYTGRNQKEITLPSGATITIRKVTPADLLQHGELITPNLSPPATASPASAPSRKEEEASYRMTMTVILECVGPLKFEGEELTLVDKPFSETVEGELCVNLLDRDDFNALTESLNEFSGFSGKEAADARTFPEEQESLPDAGHPG